MILSMQAQTLNCPMCGAAAATDATLCQHCGARLATVACPSCFGLAFIGSQFCSHCGAKIQRIEDDPAKTLHCPRCRTGMSATTLGEVKLRECQRCSGLWVDTDTLKELVLDKDKQATLLGVAAPIPDNQTTGEISIRYIPCPICKGLMNRVNFARCSTVIVDVCRQHGTWFDRDELRRIVEFIRNGGLEKARAREIEDMQDEKRRVLASQKYQGGGNLPPYDDTDPRVWSDGISAIAAVLSLIFKR
jgi:Zn-finger nucleic acid-binding protein